jgi:hypothetical protein
VRDTIVNSMIRRDNNDGPVANPRHLKRRCDGVDKIVDRFGYHITILRIVKKKEWYYNMTMSKNMKM